MVKGIHDYFLADSDIKHIPVIGPQKAAAQLEGSKEFAKEFMSRHNIPTAKYFSVTEKNLEEGKAFLSTMQSPYVLKADGLAAGVVIAIFMMLLPGTGDPSAPDPTLIDHLIWVMVLGFMGMFNSTLVYGIVTVIERITNRKSTSNKK